MRKSQKIIWAQWVDRNRPSLAPETEYCLPDSRFALMMRLARMGASDRVFRKKVPGIDSETIAVARKIAAGTVTGGPNYQEDEPGEAAG